MIVISKVVDVPLYYAFRENSSLLYRRCQTSIRGNLLQLSLVGLGLGFVPQSSLRYLEGSLARSFAFLISPSPSLSPNLMRTSPRLPYALAKFGFSRIA
jgi:hypothetical protein